MNDNVVARAQPAERPRLEAARDAALAGLRVAGLVATDALDGLCLAQDWPSQPRVVGPS